MVHPIDALAAVIRQHPNDVPTGPLATAIHLTPGEPDCRGCNEAVADIIERVNPDRTMGAGALAEAIWYDLNPDDA